MQLKEHINLIQDIPTPYYFYDTELLQKTLKLFKAESDKYGFIIHYAIKANANKRILKMISALGYGADCVSGNEITEAIKNGFNPDKIVFAGVGKNDAEINTGLDNHIFSFNVESLSELKVIEELASASGRIARLAIRINPNVDPLTHRYINTGVEESKFGVNFWDMEEIIGSINKSKYLELKGLHFHIGSQVKRMTPYKALCVKINEIQDWFNNRNIYPEHINVGGGLGIDYDKPESEPNFREYFSLFDDLLVLRKGQKVHFELGRSLVGQSGSLISKVLYVKRGSETDFLILDAGMTDLLRPALYQAYHKIENLSSSSKEKLKYNVVGPICESSDCFGRFIELPHSSRGDLIAIRSSGAYGRVMSMQYNLRDLPTEVFSK